MNPKLRIIGILWTVVGTAIAGLCAWGFLTQIHSRSVVVSWLIALVFAALALVAGLGLARSRPGGLIPARIVSVVSLIYALAWLMLGGVDDAGGYAIPLILLVVLSVSSLVLSWSRHLPNKTMEPTR